MARARLNSAKIAKDLRLIGRAVYGPKDFLTVIRSRRLGWEVPVSIGSQALLERLVEARAVKLVTLKSETYSDVKRVCVEGLKSDPLDLALSLRGGAYLCHASAVYVHGLTEQLPRTIYVNKEQSAKREAGGALTQLAIDRAFANAQRKSNYSWRVDGYRIVQLSGKATGAAGVLVIDGRNVTGLERTLIDITVRPKYAGGVFQVLQAFEGARNRTSIEALRTLLSTIRYKYPYHQALGFYLSKAGWPRSETDIFRSMGVNFDFYLDYSMASPEYDSEWRVFYPKGV